MKHGQSPSRRPRVVVQMSMAGVFFAVPQIAMADDEIRTSADVAATSGWSSNPFSETGKNLGSAYVEIDVRPVISLVGQHSVIALSGLLDYQHYFHNYADSNDYGGGLDYSGTLSSRLTVHANAHYDSSIIGGFDSFTTVTDPTQPQAPVTTGPDFALVGTRARRRTLSFGGNAAYSLSPYDSVTANAYYNQDRYGGADAVSDYNGYGGGVGYSRLVSARLQLGLQASTSRYVYHRLFGNSQVYSVQATFRDQLSARWTISGALGASFSSQTLGSNQTNFTGNLQLCRQSPRSTLCLTASDAVLPTGYTGTVDSKAVGASYSYSLTEHSTLALSVQYSHNGQPIDRSLVGPVIADSYVTAGANYDRQLSQRVHFIAATHYRKLIGGQLDRTSADFGGSLGILVRLGATR